MFSWDEEDGGLGFSSTVSSNVHIVMLSPITHQRNIRTSVEQRMRCKVSLVRHIVNPGMFSNLGL